ncbi:MAG: hypothetical protein M3Z35_09095 [Nitrospirota bacterium]|nr:hypothetical protein [Nitrospirota bacterium]
MMTQTPSGDALHAHARLTLGEGLELLEISRSALYERLQRREFPFPIRHRRSVRRARHEVLAYLLNEEIRRG